MSLRIIQTCDLAPASVPLKAAVRDALAASGRAEVLVPTFAQGLDVQKALAQAGEATLGVGCTTAVAWAKERWEVFGDGSRPVVGSERLALASLVLQDHSEDSPVPPSRGSLDALAEFVRDGLAWLPLANDGWVRASDPRAAMLSTAEQSFVSLAGLYRAELRNRRLVEPCEIMRDLPDALREAGVAPVPLVATGFTTMPYPVRMLLVGMSRDTEVTVVVGLRQGPAGRLAEELVARLEENALESGLPCEVLPVSDAVPTDAPGIAPELASLGAALYRAGEEGFAPLTPEGSVRLLEAAGPLAESELVASAVAGLPADAREVVVSVPDTNRAFAEIAPKLAARGMRVLGMRCRGGMDFEQACSLLGFASLLARLSELDWPAPDDSHHLLGDMSWWPAHEVTDFLLSEASGVDVKRAWRIDAEFRGNRILAPEDVFTMLRREKTTSRACATTTTSILRGRLDRAATQLMSAAKAEGRVLSDDAVSALSAVRAAAVTAARIGVLAETDPRDDDDITGCRRVPLSTLVQLIEELVRHETVCERIALGPEDAARTVRICSRYEVSNLPAGSADALVACGLTIAEMPLTPNEGAVPALEERLGIGSAPDPLDRERSSFAAAVAVPRKALLLERVLSDASSSPAYPAVPLTELLACYGSDEGKAPKGMPRTVRGEGAVGEALSAAGVGQRRLQEMQTPVTGSLSERSRAMVLVPREGEEPLPDDMPSLSASQIESYLECPFKWFTLRRLGLQSVDAGFTAMERGSFAHFVLERTYSGLLEDAMRASGMLAADEPFDQLATTERFVPGSSVSSENLDDAIALMGRSFAEHLDDQAQHARRRSAQSLVPHTKREESELGQLYDSLESLLEFDVVHFRGFEPRYFELRFGGRHADARQATYAGVDLVGTIDRVDVAANGDAIVIDYKHKSPYQFEKEYDVFAEDGCADIASFTLPRRVQTLIYAQVLRRQMPDLNVVGAVYVATKEDSKRDHAISGVVDEGVADRVFPEGIRDARRSRLVSGGENIGFDQVLDETERQIAEALARLRAGEIEANPVDKAACSFCPVHECERRMA